MKKKGKIIIFVVIIALIVVAIAIGIYKNNIKQSSESVTSGESEPSEETENNILEQNEIVEEDTEHTHESEEIKLTEIEAPDSKREIPETKKFESYEINSLTLYLKDGESTLIGKIKNTSDETTPEIKINLTFTDEKGEEIITIGAVIVELQPGTETELNTSVDVDITNAADFTITRDLS